MDVECAELALGRQSVLRDPKNCECHDDETEGSNLLLNKNKCSLWVDQTSGISC